MMYGEQDSKYTLKSLNRQGTISGRCGMIPVKGVGFRGWSGYVGMQWCKELWTGRIGERGME